MFLKRKNKPKKEKIYINVNDLKRAQAEAGVCSCGHHKSKVTCEIHKVN